MQFKKTQNKTNIMIRIHNQLSNMDGLAKTNISWGLYDIIFGFGCIISAIIMIYRVFFGTEFTDEAFYVSDALAIMHGNIPYTYDTVIVAGQAFVPLLFYKIYELVIPDMEGILLYSRITYTLFRFLIIFYIFRSLENKVERRWRLLLSGILIVYVGYIPNWSYNETSMVLILFTIFFLKKTLKYDESVKKQLRIGIAGFITAIAVFTHQGCAVAVISFIIILFLNSKKNYRFKNIFAYCVGGIIEILIVMLPIMMQSGLGRLFYGIKSMMLGPPDNYFKNTFTDRVQAVILLGYRWWVLMIFLSAAIFILSIRYIRINEQKLSQKEYWLMSVSVSILMCIGYASYRGLDIPKTVGILCVGAFILLIPTYEDFSHLAWFFGIYNILFIIVLTMGSLTGDRFFYCVPMILPILIDLFKTKHRLFHEIGAVTAILLIILLGRYSFQNIYRDDSFRNLTACVEEGVFKGIYTTPDRAKDVVELEHYINNNILPNEAVSFRDNAPVAYLMRNKNICDVRTWDIMQYSYQCNDPTLMYRYYKNKQQIPDVIAYIDFGRDEILSIEDTSENFQFNNFVNKYYYLDKDDFRNNTFRVLIYRNNGTFNNDYDGLLESITK